MDGAQPDGGPAVLLAERLTGRPGTHVLGVIPFPYAHRTVAPFGLAALLAGLGGGAGVTPDPSSGAHFTQLTSGVPVSPGIRYRKKPPGVDPEDIRKESTATEPNH